MNNRLSTKERAYLGRVKELPCSVCEKSGPGDAHHIKQDCQFTAIALCKECHLGSFMGWHGQKRAWTMAKMDELDALNMTLMRLNA